MIGKIDFTNDLHLIEKNPQYFCFSMGTRKNNLKVVWATLLSEREGRTGEY